MQLIEKVKFEPWENLDRIGDIMPCEMYHKEKNIKAR